MPHGSVRSAVPGSGELAWEIGVLCAIPLPHVNVLVPITYQGDNGVTVQVGVPLFVKYAPVMR